MGTQSLGAAPERYAVIGDPVAHSRSPQLHEAAYCHLGIEHASYERIHVLRGQFGDFASGILPSLSGVSVTMPHKQDAFAFATLHDEYAHLGVANTLVPLGSPTGPRRRWAGLNTDIGGIKGSLHAVGVTEIESATILGSGATALSLVVALRDMGCTRFAVCARSLERLRPVISLIESSGAHVDTIVPWESPFEAFGGDVVASALAIDGARDLHARVNEHITSMDESPRAIFDALYDPWPSPVQTLHASLADAGAPVAFASGAHMLAYQAALQVEAMFGVDGVPGDLLFREGFADLIAPETSS